MTRLLGYEPRVAYRVSHTLTVLALNPGFERCSGSGKDIFALDNAFALIDQYICADLSIDPSLFPCSRAADHTFRDVQGRKQSFKIKVISE
jgi:hypothetical protein